MDVDRQTVRYRHVGRQTFRKCSYVLFGTGLARRVPVDLVGCDHVNMKQELEMKIYCGLGITHRDVVIAKQNCVSQ